MSTKKNGVGIVKTSPITPTIATALAGTAERRAISEMNALKKNQIEVNQGNPKETRKRKRTDLNPGRVAHTQINQRISQDVFQPVMRKKLKHQQTMIMKMNHKVTLKMMMIKRTIKRARQIKGKDTE